ncbi:MAG TPA: hypothetical protein VKB30_05965 [Candidatus Limnocylindrales bacterium]|nr:hypothetical protein [Candidatus Limnocylindrales bacterium]
MTQATVGTARGRLRDLTSRLPDGLVDAAWIWFVLRVGLGLLGILAVVGGHAAGPCPSDAPLQTFLPRDGVGYLLVGVWQHWDACWYSTIAAYGYEQGTGSTNMFPLFPVLIASAAGVKGNIALAGLVVSAVAFIVALTGLHQLVARDVDPDVARRTVLFLAIFPGALWYFAPYTESVFLAAAVWAILAARRRRWEIVLVAGAAAALARPPGVLLVLPLAWELLMQLRAEAQAGSLRLRVGHLGAAVAVAAPLVAYGAFVAWTALAVGTPYFEANAAWGGHRVAMPWDRFADAYAYAITHAAPTQILNIGAWCLFAVLTLAALRLLPFAYVLFAAPQLVLTMTQDTVWPLMSTMRYLGVLFPCFAVLAIAGRQRRIATGWTVLSLLLLGWFAMQWFEGRMVG